MLFGQGGNWSREVKIRIWVSLFTRICRNAELTEMCSDWLMPMGWSHQNNILKACKFNFKLIACVTYRFSIGQVDFSRENQIQTLI
jgi:hypothetical protein